MPNAPRLPSRLHHTAYVSRDLRNLSLTGETGPVGTLATRRRPRAAQHANGAAPCNLETVAGDHRMP